MGKLYTHIPQTTEELNAIRSAVDSMSEKQIESALKDCWMNEDVDSSCVDDDVMRQMKQRIDKRIHSPLSIRRRVVRWTQIAAAILLPVFIVLTFYYYNDSRAHREDKIVVSTGAGERARVTLPDGTQVMLNAESCLTYQPRSFNKTERFLNFEGEGYFDVEKNREIPFRIDATGLKVEVLGTKFNLNARTRDITAELALEEGSVQLVSTQTDNYVIIKPGQRAALNRKDGKITVFSDVQAQDASAWRQGKLVFRATPLSDVLHKIEQSYAIHITVNDKTMLKELFTGTLPTDDINEVLDIIEKSFHLQGTLENRTLLLR